MFIRAYGTRCILVFVARSCSCVYLASGCRPPRISILDVPATPTHHIYIIASRALLIGRSISCEIVVHTYVGSHTSHASRERDTCEVDARGLYPRCKFCPVRTTPTAGCPAFRSRPPLHVTAPGSLSSLKPPPVYLYIITLASPAATPVSHTVVPHPPLLIHYTFPCPTLRPTLYYYYITVTTTVL